MTTIDPLNPVKVVLATRGIAQAVFRVHPGASVTKIKGEMSDGSIRIAIAAVPDDGKANAALIAFLAEEFGVAKSRVEIVAGQTARRKVIRVKK